MQKKIYHFGLKFEATYIDKMTDKPVIDITITKPDETIKFRRISSGLVLPLSSIDNVVNTYVHKYTNNTYPGKKISILLFKKIIRAKLDINWAEIKMNYEFILSKNYS